MADEERDGRIAELLDERRREDSSLRNLDTLHQFHPDLAEEVVRLAQIEHVLAELMRSWDDSASDDTVSSAGQGRATAGRAALDEAPETQDEQPPALRSAEGESAQIGRYHVLKILGQGGMGTVYAADDPQLQRRVAIKVPHFSGSADHQELAQKRFLREARSAAAVEHPNVCPIYDVGEHQGRPFVVMALIDGVPLTDRIKKTPEGVATSGVTNPEVSSHRDDREAARLVLKIAQGLAAVHAHGIVHRDLKPANILLRAKDGEPILTDFGLAQVSSDGDQLTADGVILGTPAYMAPEQADPTLGSVTTRSDVFSLGVIFFELLTGRRPFEGNVMQIVGQLSSRPIPRAAEFRSDVAPALDALLARAMARNPVDRFLDAKAFADALWVWLDGAVARSAALARAQTDKTIVLPRPARRKPYLVSVVAAAAVVVVVALAAFLMRNGSQPNPPNNVPAGPGVAGDTDKKKPSPAVAPEVSPTLKGDITVKVWRQADFDSVSKQTKHAGYALQHPAALPMAPGDWIRIEVALDRPAYCYVIWIDTEGQVTPLYPWLDMDWKKLPAFEQPTDKLSLPHGEGNIAPLGPGPAGMETILLLTRGDPLPRGLDLVALLGPLPTPKAPDMRCAAWFENGKLITQELDRGPIRLDQTRAVANPVLETQMLFRDRLGELFRYSRAVSFANKGDRP